MSDIDNSTDEYEADSSGSTGSLEEQSDAGENADADSTYGDTAGTEGTEPGEDQQGGDGASQGMNLGGFRAILEAEGVEHSIDWDSVTSVQSEDEIPEELHSYLVLEGDGEELEGEMEFGAELSDEFDEGADEFEPEGAEAFESEGAEAFESEGGDSNA